MKSSSSSTQEASSQSTRRSVRKRRRHFETRIFYTDYDTGMTRKLIELASAAMEAAMDTKYSMDDEFYRCIANEARIRWKDHVAQSVQCLVGNNFSMMAEAVAGSLLFFAIGDVKILLYISPQK